MCYFNGVPKMWTKVIPRRRAIKAWKALEHDCDSAGCIRRGRYVAICRATAYVRGKPTKATAHGIYALTSRQAARDYDCSAVIKRVLLWGRVRYYQGAYVRGYRAQYCMVL